jgi:hypothetical protein
MTTDTPAALSPEEIAELGRLAQEVATCGCVGPYCRHRGSFYELATPARIAALLAEVERGRADTARLEWLEATLNVGSDPVEVFFAGLRSNINLMRPDAIQVELEAASKTYHGLWQGRDLRGAIDAARSSLVPEGD